MDFKEFRVRGKEVTEWVADYLTSIRSRRVVPDVEPGYMQQLIPESAPGDGESWEQIFNDFEHIVMPGVTHWQSPYNHAYFPCLTSPISMLGEMLANSINCLGFTWASSPACTELEIITTDWAAKMLGLPESFLHSQQDTHGGGSIHTTASEATLVSLLAARRQAIEQCREKSHCSEVTDSEINSRLVAYCSDQAHSSVEKAAIISIVTIRLLPSDEQLSLRGSTLREAIQQDIEDGFVPFYVCATLGTTGACGFDNLRELGVVCRENGMWLHVDAAYAGSAFVCPEFRWLMRGIDLADSFVFNASKWLLVHFDCTLMWVKDSTKLHRTFNMDPLYLRHENAGKAVDFMHWQIPLSKRFRSLKLWFVMKSYGVCGLQQHIRKSVSLAKLFEGYVRSSDVFEIPAKRHLGLVVFRLKGENFQTETLLRRLNATGLLQMVPASIKGKYIIRYTVTSPQTCPEDIERDWKIISQTAYSLLDEMENAQEKDSSIEKVANSVISNGVENGSSSVPVSKVHAEAKT